MRERERELTKFCHKCNLITFWRLGTKCDLCFKREDFINEVSKVYQLDQDKLQRLEKQKLR